MLERKVYMMNDIGNADRLVDSLNGQLLPTRDLDRPHLKTPVWYEFRNGEWVRVPSEEMFQRWVEVRNGMHAEADAMPEGPDKTEAKRWATSSGMRSRINGAIKTAADMLFVTSLPERPE